MVAPVPAPLRNPLPRRRLPTLPEMPGLRWLGVGLLIGVSLYLTSPYLSLWRLDQTAVNGPTAALESLVDLDAIREQIRRRLNKDQESAIGEVSDTFIDWVQQNIRRNGEDAFSQAVSLAWVRQRLLAHGDGQQGFWHAMSYAFFETPTRFRVRIGAQAQDDASKDADGPPAVNLLLERGWLRWRLSAISY
jgi:hypothetical protein